MTPKGKEVELGEEKVFVTLPGVDRFQIVQQRAEISAIKDLREMKDELSAMPIDSKAWEAATSELPEGSEKPKKPKNKYEQLLEQERNSRFLLEIAPYMIIDKDGNRCFSGDDERNLISDQVAKHPEVLSAVSEKIREFGEAMSAKTADKKK
jgi:hypothetical protein